MKRTKKPSSNPRKPHKNNKKQTQPKPANNGANGDISLTPKQEAFVKEYLVDLNATQAAIRAGYSETSAGVVGSQNLRKPNIEKAIEHEMNQRQERTKVNQDKVIKELAKLAFSNMKSFMRWGPNSVTILHSDQLSDDDAACVSEITQTANANGGTIRLKLHDKRAALELLGRHLGMFSDTIKNVVIGDDSAPLTHKFEFSDIAIKNAFEKLYGREKE